MTRLPKINSADGVMLRDAYRSVTRASGNSLRAAWRFGQVLDGFSDRYTRAEMAHMLELSPATVYRYHRFYGAFQRPELAMELAEKMETWNLDLLIAEGPAPVHRPLAGRHFRYRCHGCQSLEVVREEYEPDDEEAAS